jgi:tetratricopeptide (TPR) repeat protein
LRSSLALAECLQQTNSLPAALEVLESEGRNGDGSPQERLSLHFQLGVIYEMLGNLQEAMDQFNLVLKQNSRHAAAEERMQSLRKRMEVESK